MKRCKNCGCLAFDNDYICRKCNSDAFVDVLDANITMREGILMVEAIEKNAPFDEKRCLSYLSDIVPGLQKEIIMLKTAFSCGAIDLLRKGNDSSARQIMSDSGMNTNAINVVLNAYGFKAMRETGATRPIPIHTPPPPPTQTQQATPVTPLTPKTPKTPPTPSSQTQQANPVTPPTQTQQTPPVTPSTPKNTGGPKGMVTGLAAIVAVAAILAIGFIVTNNNSGTHVSSKISTSVTTEEADSLALDDEGANRAYKGTSVPVSNLINGGHMGGNANGDLVFANPVQGTDWDTKSLIKTNAKGTSKTTIYTAPDETVNLYHLNVLSDCVIFNQVIDNASTVVSVGLDGKNVKTLDSCDDWSLCQFHDGWVYYRKNGMLCRCDSKGNNKSTLCNVGTNTYWRVMGNDLYFFNEGGDSDIRVSKIDGSKSAIANHASSGHTIKNAFPVDSDHLVLLEQSTSNDDTLVRLYTISSKSSTILIPDTPNIERVCSYSDGVIATQKVSEGNYRIFSSSYSSQSAKIDIAISNNSDVRYTSCIDNLVMFGEISSSECSVRGFTVGSSSIITFN